MTQWKETVLYPAKLPFRSEGEMQYFPNNKNQIYYHTNTLIRNPEGNPTLEIISKIVNGNTEFTQQIQSVISQ